MFDYGGQKEFHITHDRFFEGSKSIFLIVIGLLDRGGRLKEMKELQRELDYWKKFILSCTEGEFFILFSSFLSYFLCVFFLEYESLVVFSKTDLVKEEDRRWLEEVKRRFTIERYIREGRIREPPLFIGHGEEQALKEIEESIVFKHNMIQEVLSFFLCFLFLYHFHFHFFIGLSNSSS